MEFVIENGTLMHHEGRGGKVAIPCGVKHIGFAAFANSEITEVVIPRGVEEIGYAAFAFCESLKTAKTGEPRASRGAYFRGATVSKRSSCAPVAKSWTSSPRRATSCGDDGEAEHHENFGF